jgi:GNAT superfamily N-acetyltransferase
VVLAAVLGDRHPDRAVVDVAAGTDVDALGLVAYRGRYRPDGELGQVWVNPALLRPGPDLWYVEVPEPEADPPATNLLAIATTDLPAGTVAPPGVVEQLGTPEHRRVGSLRWWVGNGQVHQIYVDPRARRQGVATSLGAAGCALALGRGWPTLWGTGELTDLGVAWTTGKVWSSRIVGPRTPLPPMTPAPEADGLPPRLLEPDEPGAGGEQEP